MAECNIICFRFNIRVRFPDVLPVTINMQKPIKPVPFKANYFCKTLPDIKAVADSNTANDGKQPSY